jgi:UDP-N-acetylmuramate dehydrogenase
MNQAIELPASDCLIYPEMSLANLTSYRVGGNAQWYVAPKSVASLQASLEWREKQDVPLTILGAGSNLLIGDTGLEGLVVNTRYLRGTEIEEEAGRITADAGEPIAKMAWKAAKRGWRGFEWAVGIPGSIGGSIVMNAGAHSRCVADILVSALVLNPDGSIESLTPDRLNYSYRTSNLQKEKRIVLQATFQLQPDSTKAEVMAATTANLNQRKNSQPYHLPSCGSVFRNPKPQAAGWLIEQLGLKGYQIGGAQVAHRHANFILNCGNAKANDIFRLMQHIQAQVDRHWSLILEPEVKMIGEFSRATA